MDIKMEVKENIERLESFKKKELKTSLEKRIRGLSGKSSTQPISAPDS
jgi:hypothetical protein